MPKLLYLHIGHQKTGTTALQSFFAQNVERLEAAGVLYPQTGQIHNAHYGLNFSLGIGRSNLEIAAPEILRAQLRDEVTRSRCERVLISSEYFATTPAVERVKEFFSDYDVRVVVYLRRHDHALESAYGQSVKGTESPPWQPNVESFALYQLNANAVLFDYLQNIRRWAIHFGKDAILVRPYERKQNTPDLFADFLRTIEVDDSSAFIRSGDVNVSLSSKAISAIQALRRTSIPRSAKNVIVSGLIELDTHQDAKTCYLSPSMRNALIVRHTPSYTVIAKEFLGRENGMLFQEPIPRPTDEWNGVPHHSEDETLDFILNAVALRMNWPGKEK